MISTIGAILQILGSLAFFIFGMKMMSEGIQRAAGSQLRSILRTMTKNRYLGVFTGFLVTALVQSSSASTVMTVSFVNAGLLSLVESAGVMMGANIGTTITGWLISILGFRIKLSAYSIPLFAIGLPMLFSRRMKLKYWGEFIIGFAILFMGLSFLKEAVPDLKGNTEALDWLKAFTEYGFFSRVFFVLVGAMVTIIVQSSSAAMAVTLTMCAQGWLPFEVAAAMILGENIGTTITAELASIVGNTNAKRSARIHSMFNIVGVTWMVILMPLLLPMLANFVETYLGVGNPYTSAEDMPIGLSAFHTFFNLTNVLLLIGFVPFLVRAAIWSVKGGPDDDEEVRLKFISTSALTPELATTELQKETAHYAQVTARMNDHLRKLIQPDLSLKKRNKFLKKLKKYEEITDDLEIEITEYITKLANKEVTPETSVKLRNVVNICNDLERIGDVFYQSSKIYERLMENELSFNSDQLEGLNNMIDLIEKSFEVMINNLESSEYSNVTIGKAAEVEKEINDMRNQLNEYDLKNIGSAGYNMKTSRLFNNLFSLLERIGDHVMNVNKAITGEI
jgi:phosphate:Na+ symporter